jgi:hypothetical protein
LQYWKEKNLQIETIFNDFQLLAAVFSND